MYLTIYLHIQLKKFFNNRTSLHSLLFREVVYWRLPHLSLPHWLIMRVGFEIKGSKRESSVNRLNLFKVLISSSTSFLQGRVTCSSDTLSSLSSSPFVIASAVAQKIQKQSIQQTMVKISWLQVGSVLLGTLNFFVRSIFVKLFQFFIFCF